MNDKTILLLLDFFYLQSHKKKRYIWEKNETMHMYFIYFNDIHNICCCSEHKLYYKKLNNIFDWKKITPKNFKNKFLQFGKNLQTKITSTSNFLRTGSLKNFSLKFQTNTNPIHRFQIPRYQSIEELNSLL